MVFRFFLLTTFLLILSSCANSTSSETKETTTAKEMTSDQSAEESKTKKNIIFFGDSLTAAYRLDPEEGFTSILQRRIDSLGLNYKVINAGLSGETTAGGNDRVNWVIRQPVDIFVLELGGNDGLRGIDPDASKENLQSIIDKVKAKYEDAKIVLAGMEAPPNMGDRFTQQFREMYPQLAQQNGAALIPFLLDGVGGIPELNLPDGIHPNEEGQKIVAENVWRILKDLL